MAAEPKVVVEKTIVPLVMSGGLPQSNTGRKEGDESYKLCNGSISKA